MVRRIALCLFLVAISPAADSARESIEPIILTGMVVWPGTAGAPLIEGGPEELLNLRGEVPQAIIGPVTIRNSFQVVHVSKSATVGRLEVRGLDARVTDACIRGHADVVVVRDTRCIMTNGPQTGSVNIPFGLQVTSAASVSVSNSSFEGFLWSGPEDRYWIGEGVTVERGVTGVQFDGVTSNGNTDAGFDIKPFVNMTDVSASDNCRNFRFWSGAEVGTMTTGDTIKRGGNTSCSGIWLSGSATGPTPRLHVRKLIVRMTRPGIIIEVENGPADIQIDECDIKAPPGSSMVLFKEAPGERNLGRGCKLPDSNR
jgi:hypothetical protein